MNRISKNIFLTFVICALCFAFAGCEKTNTGNKSSSSNKKAEEKINYTETIKVYNAAEYMDMSTIKDFEREYAIKVEYEEFDSNEDMYSDIKNNPYEYDVLVPSDYMIDRLIKENRLAKLDKSKVSNIANIDASYLNPSYDVNNDYVIPYMTGTLGILYNKKLVYDTVDSWSALWDARYRNEIFMWDSMRDVIAAAQKLNGYSVNSSSDSELEKVKNSLLSQKNLVRAYAEEEARDYLIADDGTLALVYSGEAKAAIDQNPNLAYVIPKEGSNKFVDGFVILKDTKHMDAAQKFINFMCRPNIAVRNMTSTGYTSPVKGAWAEFGDNKIMFPSQEELARCETFLYDANATNKYSALWSAIR